MRFFIISLFLILSLEFLQASEFRLVDVDEIICGETRYDPNPYSLKRKNHWNEGLHQYILVTVDEAQEQLTRLDFGPSDLRFNTSFQGEFRQIRVFLDTNKIYSESGSIVMTAEPIDKMEALRVFPICTFKIRDFF